MTTGTTGAFRQLIHPSEYMTEADVLKRWPQLSRAELKRARKTNPPNIAFYDFSKRGGGPATLPPKCRSTSTART